MWKWKKKIPAKLDIAIDSLYSRHSEITSINFLFGGVGSYATRDFNV